MIQDKITIVDIDEKKDSSTIVKSLDYNSRSKVQVGQNKKIDFKLNLPNNQGKVTLNNPKNVVATPKSNKNSKESTTRRLEDQLKETI